MRPEQIIVGTAIAALCANGLWLEQTLLTQTIKGQRLVRWLGTGRAFWMLRFLLVAGVAFGLLLATNWIRPIQWGV